MSGRALAATGAVADGRDLGASAVSLDGLAVPFHEPLWVPVAAFRPDLESVDG